MLELAKEAMASAKNREEFFRIIASIFPTLDCRYQLIEKAYNDAKDAFRGLKRADGVVRYFEHIRAVTLLLIVHMRVRDYNLIVAALLHDVVEDVPSWNIQRVKEGYGNQVALWVEWMTKPYHIFSEKSECHRVYHGRFEVAPREFFLIKLADRLHNLTTIWSMAPEKRLAKIEDTERYYLPYAEKHCILIHELEAAIAAAR